MTPPTIDRLYDLLAAREAGPVTPEEEAELNDLRVKWPHVEPDEFTGVAALLQAATAPVVEPSPLFMELLEADATVHFLDTRPSEVANRRRRPTVIEWCVMASLIFLVGAEGWRLWERQQNRPQVALTPAAEREKLLTAGAKQYAAKAGGGDVVWDGATQRGYLNVSGLEPNNPAKSQYQLWIVDAGRTHKEPVDGGVFDVGPDGSAVVPIRAALAIRNPVLFAVTEEPPGGVVVSEAGKRGEFKMVFGD